MADSHALAYRPGRAVAMNTTVPQTSPFLALPPEVRLGIYDFLVEGGILHIDAPKGCNCAACSFNKRETGHGILLACRLCRNESRASFFRSTLWVFPTLAWSSLDSFTVSPRSTEGVKLVRCISVGLATLKVQRSFDALPLLESIIVRATGYANLRSVVRGDSGALSDENIVYRIRNHMLFREPFLTLADMVSEPRKFSLSLLVRLEFLRPGKVIPHRWQHADVIINLDTGQVDRSSKGFYLAKMEE